MRLFQGIFYTLAAQALLATLVPGILVAFVMYESQQSQLAQRDSELLSAFVQTATEAARAGRPLDAVAHLPGPLAGRVSLVDPQGRPIAGPTMGGVARAERAVVVDGHTVATARIVRPPEATDEDLRLRTDRYLALAGIMTLLFLLLLVAAYFLARRWAQPQLQLYRMSRDVVHGDLDIDFEEKGPPETLATMRNLRRVASQFSRLETARRTWLVSISGELKTSTENMGEHFIRLCEMQPPAPRTLLGAIERDTHHLIQMAEDLNAVALADLGRLPVSFAPIDPGVLIDNAVEADAKRAEAQGVTLAAGKLPEQPVIVKWDEDRIGQLLGALIDNSLRYTPKGGRIALGLESARDAWRLIVDDNAPGVDVMLAQRLFDPFYRSADRANESAASGLGLATARAIVEAHHGRIEAGRSPIGGLRVTVTLPGNPPTA